MNEVVKLKTKLSEHFDCFGKILIFYRGYFFDEMFCGNSESDIFWFTFLVHCLLLKKWLLKPYRFDRFKKGQGPSNPLLEFLIPGRQRVSMSPSIFWRKMLNLMPKIGT